MERPIPVTGGLGELGSRAVWGLQLAVDKINREGGIKSLGGAKLKLSVTDTTSENPTQAASITRRMIDQEGAIVIAGASASAMTLAAQVEAEKSEIPLITNSYADGIVTRGYKYTFKLTPQGSVIWNWSMTTAHEMWTAVKGTPPKTAAIFMSNDAVGLVVQKQLPDHAKTLNLEVPFSTGFQMGLSDPSVAVAPVLRYKPDILFLGGFTNDLILIVKALRGVGASGADLRRGPGRRRLDRQGIGFGQRQILRTDDLELGSPRAWQQGIRGSLQGVASDPAIPAGRGNARSGLCHRDSSSDRLLKRPRAAIRRKSAT